MEKRSDRFDNYSKKDEECGTRRGMCCNPDVCPFCQYIGEGDSYCDEIGEIVLSDWEPTDHYMGRGCPYVRGQKNRCKDTQKDEEPSAGTIVKYAILIVAGVWLYLLGSEYGYQHRGYSALGGEFLALLLPFFYWAISSTVREVIEFVRWR